MFLFTTLAGISTLIGVGLIFFSLYFLFIPARHDASHKPYIIVSIALSAIAVQVLATPFRAFVSFLTSTPVAFICYLLLAHVFINRYRDVLKPREVILWLVVGTLTLQAPLRIYDFNDSLISLPDMLVGMLGIFAGYFLNKRHKLLNKINLALSVIILIFTVSYGYDLWLNTLNYGTPTGELNIKGPDNITLITQKSGPMQLRKGKITVMDFWFVGCGACINEFPNFQQSYNRYKANPKVQFYAVNKPTVYDKGVDSFDFLTSRGFKFPMTVLNDVAVIKEMQVTSYPTVIILNESGNIIYRGDMTGADEKLRAIL